MRALIGIALVIFQFLRHASAQGSSAAAGSITGGVYTKGTHGELGVLPSAHIVLHEPVTKDESYAKGAFADDGPPPGTYQIEANAPGLYPAFAVAVRNCASSTGPVEMNMAPVSSTSSTQLTRFRAMDRAFSRKVYHHA